MGKGYTNRYRSFCRSLSNLSLSLNEDRSNLFLLSGTVQMFNLTFDISWKLMKDILLEEYGIIDFVTGSPRDVLRTAAGTGLISDDIWLEMLDARNKLAHDYDGKIAEKYFDEITVRYYGIFANLREDIESRFMCDDG